MRIGKWIAGSFGLGPPGRGACLAAVVLLSTSAILAAQDPQDPFSTPGAITGTDTSNSRGQGRQQPPPNRESRQAIRDATETRYREEAMASRIAQLSLLDSLYVAIAVRQPEASLRALRETSEALSGHRVR